LPVDFHGTIQLVHRFFSHRAVVAEAFDFEKTSAGLKAGLPQSRQVTQRGMAADWRRGAWWDMSPGLSTAPKR
jgi:hypothetical protein